MGIDNNINKSLRNNNSGDVVWSSESYDSGTKAEENLLSFLTNVLDLKEFTLEDEKSGEHFNDVRIRKTTKFEDENKQGDFSMYIPPLKKYIHFDLTTASDRETLNYKEKNAREHGLKLLKLGFRDIELASKRCEKDTIFVYDQIRKQVLGLES